MSEPVTETKAAFAARCGVSAARVSQYVNKEGMPCGPDGRIDVARALKWIASNAPNSHVAQKVPDLLAALNGDAPRAERPKADRPAPEQRQRRARQDDDAAPTGPLPSPDDYIVANDLTEAKRLNEVEKVRLNRIKREEARKALVSKDTVRRGLHEFGIVNRDAWIAWCSRVAPDFVAEFGCDLQKVYALLDRLVRDQLIHISGLPMPSALKDVSHDD